MRRSAWTTGVAILAALSLGVAACGGGDSDSGGDGKTTSTENVPPKDAKVGGKLTALWTGDVDFIDCGRTYFQMGLFICSATQKSLYSYKPDDPVTLVPDLAADLPEISEDGKTVTIKLKQGVKYSPPYNEEVKAADVKYAIERGFFNSVASGFTASYYGDLEGAKVGVDSGTKVKGITTPDDYTVVLKFKRAVGGVMAAGALAYPATAPVPEAYAKDFDAEPQTTYGENQLSTGPYMIKNDASGKAIGYDPGKRIHLVRNPNWDKSLDFKPAYLDEIENLQGNDDAGIAIRRIMDNEGMINGDLTVPPENVKQALENTPDQLKLASPLGGRWVALNMKIKPFDDINVRKAVVAGMDRNALVLTRGGKTVGDVATHFLPPGTAGFEEAGGAKGTGVDFISPDGKPLPDVSAKYFKAAGFASGKYEGNEKILMVGSNATVPAKTAEVTKQALESMGFQVTMRLVAPQTMYTRYCNVPKAEVAVCPNVGWIRDFADGQTILSPTFAGKNILPQGNSNWSQLDDPKINEAIDAAEIAPVEERAKLWGDIDRMVTEQAVAVPWIWDKQALVQSANVNGVVAEYNSQWDLSWTSLK
jgi:peptide/nickel transport system substrate-binding protein